MSADGHSPIVSTGQLPDPAEVQAVLDAAHAAYRDLDDGEVADYIPALASAPAEAFGACIAGVTGRVYEVGDTTTEFSIQSVAKPFVFALVLQTIGGEAAREKLGVNSTGLPFNSVMAIELGADRTMNPMVNAGAIATTSLVPGAGGIVTIAPGKGGLGTWSPPLDEAGNSVRGLLATDADCADGRPGLRARTVR